MTKDGKLSMSVYPNPAVEQLNFKLSTGFNGSAEATVYDMAARQVMSASVEIAQGNGSLQVAALSAGSYFLEIAYDDVHVRTAFIKR